MKKFLSLVLALIMTMSLVTISAGATEYRDLTDKDEIQYEEAVAVLNRIGVITGYEDGSFRPEGELTRGAAAKIIVSLLIGPEAASNLPNATAPYPDVPASHTFAGVISYCKTAKIISGYGDGTFKPGNSLTGFAFAKMLLGALGYKQEIEGFVDTGWTMNVAKVGNVTGLFDRLDFDGAAAVNRETACQLALNTLKATMVTYGGTTMVTGAQNMFVQGTQAMYVTSNNREINANINRRVINAANNEMTLEFGEEHFKDLRLEHDKYDPAYDEYGHPSNEWSWKKVTIGTFKLPADYTFDKQMSHREDTAATKEKALGLRNFDTWSVDHRANTANWSTASSSGLWNSPFADATQITINGWDARVNTTTGRIYDYDASDYNNLKKKPDGVPTISEIADLTDNGVTVEVYICPVDPDFITNVVVTRTQLMKVKRLGSDYVTLEDIEPDSRGPRKDSDLNKITGYNAFGIDVTENYDGHSSFLADVKDSNYDAYNALKDLKTGDRVAVVPYTTDNGKTWEVGEAYVPETVTGAFTKVDTYANVNKREGSAVAITVGGTSYPINEWNKDMLDVKGPEIKATKKDVTLYLAKDGTALWADEIGNADAWMVVGDYYQATGTNGKVGWFVHGWTTSGDEVDLDLGTIRGDAEKYAPGELVYYKIAESGNGEYVLSKPNKEGKNHYKDGTIAEDVPDETGEGVYEVSQYTYDAEAKKVQPYQIKSRNGALALENYDNKDGSVYKYTTAGQTDADKAVKVENKTVGNKVQHDFTYSNLLYDGVKFIFVNFDGANGEVETIDFKDGVQNVDYQDLVRYNDRWKNIGTNDGQKFVVSAAEAYVNDKGVVKAVVIKADSAEADLSKIAIITDTPGDKNLNKGADDRTNGLSYAKQYVTGPNFNISEEKTGYFDKDYPIGTILVISEKENIIVGKYFHSTYYNNGNPDAMFVKGITALTRPNGGNSEAGFLIGQKDGHTVKTLDKVYTLLETGNSDKYVYGETSDVFLLGNKYVSGYDTDVENNNVKGLVRVDSATKFIDLRAINNDTIDSLGDLLDYNHDTVELRLLVNGSLSSDGFRRAYAVIVEKAGDKAVVDTGNVSLAVKDSVLPVNNIYGKVSVNRFTGKVDYTLSFKAPDWAAGVNANSDLTFEMDVKADGNTFGTVEFGTGIGKVAISKDGDVFSATGSVTVPQYALDNGKIDLETDSFSGVIKNVSWAKAGVKYIYEGGTAVANGLTGQTTSLATSGAGAAVTFNYNATTAGYEVKDNASALYVISGVTAAQTDTALKVDGTANTISGLVAKGGEWVVVTLKNLEKAKAPEPAEKYNVAANSTLTGDSAVKIHVVPAGTTLNAAYIAALTDADWSALPVTKAAAAGEKVLVKAATAGVNLTDVTRINDEDGNNVTSTLAVDAATYTSEKVVVFTMPAKNVRIATVNTDAIVISGAYIDKGYTNLYVKTPVAAAGTEAEMKAIVKFINESSDYSLDGVTAEYVPVLGGAGQIKITKGGASKTLTPNVADSHITVTINGNPIIVPTGKTLSDALGYENITMTGSAGNSFIKKTVAAGTVSAIADNTLTDTLADGSAYDTNGAAGYIQLADTPVIAAAVVTGINGALTGTPTVTLDVAAADKFTATNDYVKAGATLTVVLNNSKTEDVAAGKKVQAVISATSTTVGGNFASAADVPGLVAGESFTASSDIELTFTLSAPSATKAGGITVTLTGVANP